MALVTLMAALVLSLAAHASASAAGPISVTTAEDELNADGDCSLREAISAANGNVAVDSCAAGSGAGEDAIVFELGPSAVIILSFGLGELVVTDPAGLAIDGGNADIAISGNNQVGVFDVGDFSIPEPVPTAKLTLEDLTVTEGFSSFGGGIHSEGTLTVTNSTISNNTAGEGGGIFFRGGTMLLTGTVVAENPGGGNCSNDPIFPGSISDGGYNISDDGTCNFTSGTSRSNTDPGLDPNGLQDNGGPTKTVALLEGSPAIDAIPEGVNGCGDPTATNPIVEDQRAVVRPQGGNCDAGAFEVEQPLKIERESVDPADGSTGVPAGTNVTVAFSEPVDPATLTSETITLAEAKVKKPVEAALTSEEGRTVTLDPAKALKKQTLYMATVKGGDGGVKAKDGDPLPKDFSWFFATGKG